MTTLEKYQRVLQKVEQARQAKNRAEGAKSQLLKQLTEEFNVQLQQADKLLKKLHTEEDRLEKELTQGLMALEKEWGDKCPQE